MDWITTEDKEIKSEKVEGILNTEYGKYRQEKRIIYESVHIMGEEICQECEQDLPNSHIEIDSHHFNYEDSSMTKMSFCSLECLKKFLNKTLK